MQQRRYENPGSPITGTQASPWAKSSGRWKSRERQKRLQYTAHDTFYRTLFEKNVSAWINLNFPVKTKKKKVHCLMFLHQALGKNREKLPTKSFYWSSSNLCDPRSMKEKIWKPKKKNWISSLPLGSFTLPKLSFFFISVRAFIITPEVYHNRYPNNQAKSTRWVHLSWRGNQNPYKITTLV